MKLLLLQCKQEYCAAKKMLQDQWHDVICIAWTPYAVESLRNNDEKVIVPADVCMNISVRQRLPEYVRLVKWAELMDELAADAMPLLRELNVRPFLNKLMPFRIFFFLYFQEIIKLQSVIDQYKPEEVFFFAYEDERSVLSNVLARSIHCVVPTVLTPLSPAWDFSSILPVTDLVPNWLHQHTFFKNILKMLFKKPKHKSLVTFVQSCLLMFGLNQPKTRILVMHAGWDVSQILMQLKHSLDCQLFFWEDFLFKAKKYFVPLDKIIDAIETSSHARELMTYEGVDISEFVMPYVKKTLSYDIHVLLRSAQIFRKLQNNHKIDLVVSSHELTHAETIFDQCRMYNIPIALFTHGIGYGVLQGHPLVPLCSLRNNEKEYFYYYTFSSATDSFYAEIQEMIPETNLNVKSIGSKHFEKLYATTSVCSDMSKKEFVNICYVCGGVGLLNSFLKTAGHDDAALYRLRYQVLDCVGINNNVRLHFKFGYQSEKFGLDFERDIVSGKYSGVSAISSAKTLQDVVGEMDVVIVDSLTTAWFELLGTQKVLIFFLDDRDLAFIPDAAALLGKRVMIAHNEQELLACIQDIVQNKFNAKIFTKQDVYNDDFKNKYILGKGDANSDTAVDSLLKILRNKT